MIRMGMMRARHKGMFRSTVARTGMAAALVVAGLMAGPMGCASKPAAPATQPALPAYGIAPSELVDVAVVASEADRQTQALKRVAEALGAARLEDQRPVIKRLFVVLSDTLPAFAGPKREGLFAHQLGVVTQVRDQLANRAPEAGDSGLVDTGLAATYNAIRDLSATRFYQDEKLTALLADLHTRVTALPYSSGADHGLLLIETTKVIAQCVEQMNGTLKTKVATFGLDKPVTPAAPATQPVTPPPTTPASPEPSPSPVNPAPATPTPPPPAEPAAPTPPATPTPPAPADPGAPAPPATPTPPAPADPAAPTPPATPTPPAPADPAVPNPPATPTPPTPAPAVPGEVNK